MRAIDQPRCLCQRLVAGLVGIIWKTVLAWREVSSASQSRDGYFQFPGKYRVVSSKYSKIELSKNHMNTFSLSFVLSLSLSLENVNPSNKPSRMHRSRKSHRSRYLLFFCSFSVSTFVLTFRFIFGSRYHPYPDCGQPYKHSTLIVEL